MGTASIVLSIIGICVAWIPHLGWGGVLLGAAGIATSIPSISIWYHKPGYTGWGISGLFLGCWSIALGLAHQIKYAEGALDALVVSVGFPTFVAAAPVLGALTAVGLYLARARKNRAGMLLCAAAMFAVSLLTGWTLITADRAYLAGQSPEGEVLRP